MSSKGISPGTATTDCKHTVFVGLVIGASSGTDLAVDIGHRAALADIAKACGGLRPLAPGPCHSFERTPGKGPGVLLKDPGVLSKDPGVFSKDPGVFLKDPGVFLKDPGVLSKDPGVVSKGPEVL